MIIRGSHFRTRRWAPYERLLGRREDRYCRSAFDGSSQALGNRSQA